MTLDLVLDIGSSAVNGVRGLRKGRQCCQDLLEVPALRLHGALHFTTDGPDVVFLQPASLCCPSLASVQKLWFLSYLQTEMTLCG